MTAPTKVGVWNALTMSCIVGHSRAENVHGSEREAAMAFCIGGAIE